VTSSLAVLKAVIQAKSKHLAVMFENQKKRENMETKEIVT